MEKSYTMQWLDRGRNINTTYAVSNKIFGLQI